MSSGGKMKLRLSTAGSLLYCLLCLLSLCLSLSEAKKSGGKGLIETMKHDIFAVSPKIFDTIVTSERKEGVAVVLFYTNTDASKKLIDGEFNEFAREMRGMMKVAGLDCDEHEKFCELQNVSTFPQIVIYPPFPFPPSPFTGEITQKKLTAASTPHIRGDHIVILQEGEKGIANLDAFLTKDVAVPKVLLFSSKKSPPVMYKALGNKFHDRMFFGFIDDSQQKFVDRFHVKKFPTLLVIKGDMADKKMKPDMYEGKLKFQDLYEFLNIRSETFVKGGGYASETSAEEAKPWLIQKVPELARESHQDVCFRHKCLCVIYMTDGGAPQADVLAALEVLTEEFPSNVDRGTSFRFVWIDTTVETEFTEMISPTSLPTVVVFNPHKRLRYTMLADDKKPDSDAIRDLINKIAGGDARFTNVKKLPPFSDRRSAKSSNNKKEEL